MAIVKCRKCNHYFGEKKNSCPKCSEPNIDNRKTREKPITKEELKIDRDSRNIVIILITIGVIGGILRYLYYIST